MCDQLADHRRFQVPNIVNHHSRFLFGQLVDLSISGARFVGDLDEATGHLCLAEQITDLRHHHNFKEQRVRLG